jgi:hypothetical protein
MISFKNNSDKKEKIKLGANPVSGRGCREGLRDLQVIIWHFRTDDNQTWHGGGELYPFDSLISTFQLGIGLTLNVKRALPYLQLRALPSDNLK